MFSFLRSGGGAVQKIDPAEAVRRAEAGELTVIDVRDIGELRTSGKAKGAVHVPLMLIQAKADPRHPEHDPALSPDRPVALYCASGGRSQMAGQAMAGLGYGEVYNIGGLGDWRAGGGEIVKG